MKKTLFSRLGILICLAALMSVPALSFQDGPSQTTPALTRAVPDMKAAPTAPDVAPPFPFGVGETLTYEFKFSRFPIYGLLGQLDISVVSPESFLKNVGPDAHVLKSTGEAGKPNFIGLSALAQTRGFIPSVFKLKVKDTFLAALDPHDLGVLYGRKDIDEGKRRKRQTAVYDRKTAKLEVTDTDLNAAKPSPASRTVEIRPWSSDLLSFWYVLRTQPLVEGKTIPMTICDNGTMYTIDVTVGESEKLSTDAGKFQARKLEIKAFEGGFIRRKGEYSVWISEDGDRLPVQVKFKTSSGTVTGELVKVQRPKAPPAASPAK